MISFSLDYLFGIEFTATHRGDNRSMKKCLPTFTLTMMAILLLLGLASFLRFNGLNWDQGNHLHPDERFLTMVAAALRPLESFAEYFDTAGSGLNPHNVGHSFYVYGTLPLHLTRYIAGSLGMADYDHVFLVGRFLSACFDLTTLIATVLIGIRLFGPGAGIAAGALYAVLVLAIQNAHFFTVDSAATAFVTCALFFAIRAADGSTRLIPGLIMMAGCLACAASSKINMAGGLVLIPAGLLVRFMPEHPAGEVYTSAVRRILGVAVYALITLLVTFFIFRCLSPYLFVGPGFWDIFPNPQSVKNFRELSVMATPSPTFPPAIQWIDRSVLFSGYNLALWGTGLPFFLFAAAGILFICYRVRTLRHPAAIMVCWTLGWLIMTSLLLLPTLRYQLPALPGLAVAAGYLWAGKDRHHWQKWSGMLVFILSLGWALAFSAIYERPNPRLTASKWIMENTASGTVLAFESSWDDAIPLRNTGDPAGIQSFLMGPRLEIQTADSAIKGFRIANVLSRADILVITSNRQYGSLCRLPKLFPLTAAFYRALLGITADKNPVTEFAELAEKAEYNNSPIIQAVTSLNEIGFVPFAVFSSFPRLGPLIINDQGAEEAFTVYDHTQVTLFRKTTDFDQGKVAAFLRAAIPAIASESRQP